MDIEQEKLSRDFKLTFETPHGLRVLENLKKITLSFPQAPVFSRNSARETDFNLGMNWIHGYILNQIGLELNDNRIEDCQTEPKTETER